MNLPYFFFQDHKNIGGCPSITHGFATKAKNMITHSEGVVVTEIELKDV